LPHRPEFLTYTAEDTITLDAIASGFSAVVGSFFPEG